MSENEKIKKLFIVEIILLVAMIVITICAYRQELELIEVKKENKSLKCKIEYQKSVIMDLEEYLENRGNV